MGRRPRRRLTAGRPALLLTDLFYLDHYGNSAHFPGHAVVLAGYDDEVAYLSDTGFEELQTTRLEHLRRGAPRHSPGVPARRPDGHGARPRRAHDPRAAAPAAIDRNAAQMIEPAMGEARGPAGAAPLRRRGGRVAGRARGLAVVGALLLPGDRAPRHRRRQLPAHVLALPRRGRARRGGARRARRRPSGPTLADWRCWRRASPRSPTPASGRGSASSPRPCSRPRSACGRPSRTGQLAEAPPAADPPDPG